MISPMLLQGVLTKGSFGNLDRGSAQTKGSAGGQTSFAGILNQIVGSGQKSMSKTTSGDTVEGHAFLEQLKKRLMASGMPLDQLVADDQALDSFAKLLVGAGFKQQDVKTLIAELKTNIAKKGGVLISDLFKAASQLSPIKQGKANPPAFDISALPYIETILSKLGASRSQIRDALSEAKGAGGIDVQELMSNLKKILSGMNSQTSTTANVAEQEDLLEMMKRIGLLENDPDAASRLTTLIADLKKSGKLSLTDEITEDDLAAVILNLEQVAIKCGLNDDDFQKMIAAAKESGAISKQALIEQLTQLRNDIAEQKLSVAGSFPDGAVSSNDIQNGAMTLGKFVAALEARLASDDVMKGMPQGAFSMQEEKEGMNDFLQKVTSLQNKTNTQNITNVRSMSDGNVLVGANKKLTNSRATKNGQKGGTSFAPAHAKHPSSSVLAESGKNSGTDTGSNQESMRFIGQNGAEKTNGLLMTVAKNRQNEAFDPELVSNGAFGKEMRMSEASLEATTASSARRTLPGYLLDQVSRQIIRLRQTNQNEITLQLKPPHLGRMKLSIEKSSSGIKVNIIVEQAATKDMLLAQSNDLKTALADQGLRFDKIDVETQANFDRSMDQASQDAGQSGNRKGSTFHRVPGAVAMDAPIETEEITSTRDNGLLNLVA